jgi:hypothetical protein
MSEPTRKMCPFKDGFCSLANCELWTGTMCSIRGIGVILEKLLEKEEE